ncbi:MAG: argininosuccinate lyase [Nanoarchaeota archaeon]
MPKLWDKGVDDEEVEQYSVWGDHVIDQAMLPYDLIGSVAHAKAIHKAKFITTAELNKLLVGLKDIYALWKKDKIEVKQEHEDCHTTIELYLTEKYGQVGKKIHVGRSRNDQSTCMIRLYEKDMLLKTAKECISLVEVLLAFSKKHEKTVMPGFTHMRQAMPSSFGLWSEAFAEALLNDLDMVKNAFKLINQNALGFAASYGTTLPIDRNYTASLMGFPKVMNVLHGANSRGKFEAAVIHSLHQVMLTLGRMAAILAMWTMPEFNYVILPDKLTTGSSIMPQKHNPDVLEMMRGMSAHVQGHYIAVSSSVKDLLSGYNRDTQLNKIGLKDSFEMTISSLRMMQRVIKEMKVDKKRCWDDCLPELWATQEAYDLVNKGMPFREAYQQVAKSIGQVKKPSHPKVPPLKTSSLKKQLKQEHTLLERELQKWHKVKGLLE